jgi:arylsulfatase B
LKEFLLPFFLVICTLSATTMLLAQLVPPRPTIVIILADDLAYGDVGFNGCPNIPTPNIDALANNGHTAVFPVPGLQPQ